MVDDIVHSLEVEALLDLGVRAEEQVDYRDDYQQPVHCVFLLPSPVQRDGNKMS